MNVVPRDLNYALTGLKGVLYKISRSFDMFYDFLTR